MEAGAVQGAEFVVDQTADLDGASVLYQGVYSQIYSDSINI